jgi:hypothetical protein
MWFGTCLSALRDQLKIREAPFNHGSYFLYILFPTKVNFENDGDLYSTCSNHTSVDLVIVLVIKISKSAWY